MKIEIITPSRMLFADVPDGDVFEEAGEHYIKSGNSRNVNAVRLTDGSVLTYGQAVEVLHCPSARLVID